jgi:hypothetical protein
MTPLARTIRSMTDADVTAELGRLTARFFAAVSFPAGGRPDYAQLRDLFIPAGTLIRNSGDEPEISSVDQFVGTRQKLVDSGALTEFEETESAAVTEVFGRVAHRFSTYAKRGVQGGAAFEGRGVISTQFIQTPGGWRMTSMAWDDERPGLTIPERYR